VGKRLPSEAEWEFAFREGKSSKYKYSGSNNMSKVAWFDVQNIKKIGLKAPNSLGIYDMSGNILEMSMNPLDRFGKKKPLYVKAAKGGSFVSGTDESYEYRRASGGYHCYDIGFRCVKDIH
jgi:formylglycine-generating enzyme required for sulfatase activity